MWMKSAALWLHCWGLALAHLGTICTVPRAGDPGKILFSFVRWTTHDFTDFPSAKFHENWTQHVDPCCDENFWNIFENFPVRGHFSPKKRKNLKFFFNVLQLQAAITLQWLQTDGNSLPNDPSTGCLVSIFTVGINSESFSWPVHSIQESSPNSLHYRSDASWRHAAKCW